MAGLFNPVQLFHVVENLENRAVESWLVRMFKRARREYPNFEWTFFCTLPAEGELDAEVKALGGNVIHTPFLVGDKIRFLKFIRNTMRAGRYDVLHCHHDIMSAAYLLASVGLPFQRRIVHLHNTSMSLPTPSKWKIGVAQEPMRQLCLRMSDSIVGISREALASLVGNKNPDDSRFRVVHYGVDLERFKNPQRNRADVRRELIVDDSTRIILFVGRIVDYKNPQFALQVLSDVLKRDPRFVLVLAGTGDQDVALRELVRQRQLQERVRFLGFRRDIPELMLGSDLLIWPSIEEPMEGLGLGVVEAQAAGLPIVMSLSVPSEAIVIPELVRVLPLALGSKAWADKIISLKESQLPTRAECAALVGRSTFSMSRALSALMGLYDELRHESQHRMTAVANV